MDFSLTPARVTSDELLDEHDAAEGEMQRSLRDLRRFNSLAGGRRAYLAMLSRLVPHDDARVAILDLGTGTSDLLDAVRRRWPHATTIGLDSNVRHLAYGRALGGTKTARLAADAFHLPFLDRSVDIVASSHFFHHFAPDENLAIVRESLRVARRGIAFTDTQRHYAPLLFVRLLGALRLTGSITRYDAPASVRQGYTMSEMRTFARALGLESAEVFHLAPFRFGLVVRA
ncbi:MAG: methyltransferase domain-containing protein [Acidobacteria bacterium]|nr:methyltransferase domain-containing protein [Acidobacteriota bacterium]